MNSHGWVRLHRQFLEWEWFDDANVFRLFIYCLLKANHNDNKYRGQVVKRGTFLTSLELLSKDTGLSVRSVRTSLNKLESTGELTSKRNAKGTIIQVIKYDCYQLATSETTNERQASDKQVTTNNNDNNDKNEKNIPTFLDFKTYALSKQPDVSLEALKYKYDAWIENGWKNGKDREIKNWKTSLLQTLQYIPKQPKKVRDLDQEFYENVMKQVNANK